VSIPKVLSVYAIDNYKLLVQFDNQKKKKYDVAPLLDKEMFAPLKNPVLFGAVKVDPGGYAVVWNSKIDISENELWVNGESTQ